MRSRKKIRLNEAELLNRQNNSFDEGASIYEDDVDFDEPNDETNAEIVDPNEDSLDYEEDPDESVELVRKASRVTRRATPPSAHSSDALSKADILEAVFDKLSGMRRDELRIVAEKLIEDDVIINPRSKKAKKNFSEQLSHLAASDNSLSEEFKENASVIFEAALNEKIIEHIKVLEERYQMELEQEKEMLRDSMQEEYERKMFGINEKNEQLENEISEANHERNKLRANFEEVVEQFSVDMTEKVNSYLNYVVESWMKENEIAVDSGIRTEITESFIKSLHNVFSEHYIEVPESKVDLVDELSERLEKLEEQLNDSIRNNIKLKEEVSSMARDSIIREAAYDLTESQIEKLKSLTENIAYQDQYTFEQKVKVIKDSYFSNRESTRETVRKPKIQKESRRSLAESATRMDEYVDDLEEMDTEYSSSMERYLSALKK
jgi:hypothetical protein